jgi:hypothetical protein
MKNTAFYFYLKTLKNNLNYCINDTNFRFFRKFELLSIGYKLTYTSPKAEIELMIIEEGFSLISNQRRN